jgi:hypothetical protein
MSAGNPTRIASGVNGVPFHFLFGVGLYPLTQDVYFTEFSVVYQLRYLPLKFYCATPSRWNNIYDLVTWTLIFFNEIKLFLTGTFSHAEISIKQ